MATSKAVLNDVVYVFLTYRQSQYLPKTLRSAMDQTMLPSCLLIMDDASPDNSDEIIKKLIETAPEELKIDYQRNEKNIGLIAQLNKLVEKYSDKLIIIQAGDDEAYSNRVAVTYDAWIRNNKPSLVLANYDGIDAEGKIVEPFSEKKPQKKYTLRRLINRRAMVYGCCAAVNSELLNSFGPIRENVINEDRINAFRALLSDGIVYVHQALIKYRIEGGISSFKTESAIERLCKLKVEAEREMVDIQCHRDDLEKVHTSHYLLRSLNTRQRYLEWIQTLDHPLKLKDIVRGWVFTRDISGVNKVLKKLQDC